MLTAIMTIEEYEFWKERQEAEDICDCCGEPCQISENQLISVCDFCKMD